MQISIENENNVLFLTFNFIRTHKLQSLLLAVWMKNDDEAFNARIFYE